MYQYLGEIKVMVRLLDLKFVIVVIIYLNVKKTTKLLKVSINKKLKNDNGKVVGFSNNSDKSSYW